MPSDCMQVTESARETAGSIVRNAFAAFPCVPFPAAQTHGCMDTGARPCGAPPNPAAAAVAAAVAAGSSFCGCDSDFWEDADIERELR